MESEQSDAKTNSLELSASFTARAYDVERAETQTKIATSSGVVVFDQPEEGSTRERMRLG